MLRSPTSRFKTLSLAVGNLSNKWKLKRLLCRLKNL